VANFVVKSCTPAPVVDVVVAAADSGAPVRSTTYRGLVWVSVDTNQGPSLTEGLAQWFLPDSIEYRREDVNAGGTAACTVIPVGQTPITADLRVVVGSASASFGDEPTTGRSKVFLSAGLQTTNLLEAFAVTLSYQATTLVPHR
jgi:hypothetical protein